MVAGMRNVPHTLRRLNTCPQLVVLLGGEALLELVWLIRSQLDPSYHASILPSWMLNPLEPNAKINSLFRKLPLVMLLY